MGKKSEIKKICLSIIVFTLISIATSYKINTITDALEQEKSKLEQIEPEYKGDSYDESMNLNDDIVIKIIEKMDSSLDIKYINKIEGKEDNNKSYTYIELSVSGNIDKIKEIENVLNSLNLNYKIDSMDIKNPKSENEDNKDYVDCIMMFKVI